MTRPPREPSPGFFTGAASGPTETVIRSHHPCLIDPQTRLLCCVYTDSDTAEGDSGAALIDEDDKIVGFAMGRSSYDSRVQFSYWAWAQQVYTAHGLAAGRTLGVVTEHGDH